MDKEANQRGRGNALGTGFPQTLSDLDTPQAHAASLLHHTEAHKFLDHLIG
ncbi:hypothetical protein E2C01_094170 [Portunus trituberculatus]|uniref:Uncharacterized protein n=1 Tax=Portunus trituberculatus TaxID=210409 RepID=A0A5B7K0W2_PORTR|nr:hypothetical protein [Portunus trituberculatus]